MSGTEPLAIGWLLTAAGVLMLVSVLFSRPSEKIGFPAVLLFLGLGLLAGGWLPEPFADYDLAFRIGTVGLVLILFDGGLNTPWRTAREHLAPASVLATLGVVGTAALVAVAGRLLGLGWTEALLVGAIVSSTDAAAVFSALRGSNVQLRRRVGATLELESGLNDPMAVILTLTLTGVLLHPETFSLPAFLLEIHVIHRGTAPTMNLLHPMQSTGVEQNPLAERGLARIDVGRNANVSQQVETHRITLVSGFCRLVPG